MKPVPGVLALVALLTVAVYGGEAGGYIYVKDITMHMSDGNATFDLNYSLETFARLYVLALGCRYLEPDLLSIFKGCGAVKLLSAGTNCASVKVTKAGKYAEGRYLFEPLSRDSKDVTLKDGIPRLTVIYPEGRSLTFYNVTSVQSIFREAEALSSANTSISPKSIFNGSLNMSHEQFDRTLDESDGAFNGSSDKLIKGSAQRIQVELPRRLSKIDL